MRQSKKPMKVIGITGGIGAGKTEILQYIKQHYCCKIYLADEVAHKIEEPGQDTYEKLVHLLGRDILQEDGTIAKNRMAEKIFGDSSLLAQVNAIVHPGVHDYIIREIALTKEEGETELFFLEAALLIEAGYQNVVEELWYIHADKAVREKRLMEARNYSLEKVRGIMDKQLSEEIFRRECDFCIENSGVLEDAYRQIRERLEAYTWRD